MVMEPVLTETIEHRPSTVYQVKWDGVRMITFCRHQDIVLQNKKRRIKTSSFPELQCLQDIPNQPLVLDGEIISIRQGVPDFAQILSRNFTSRPSPGAPPIAYIIFDVLFFQGKDVRDMSLEQRQQLLNNIKLPPGPVSKIDNFNDGEKLLQLTKERGWEGIVSKELSSPYIGGKSSHWTKIKNNLSGEFVIVGFTTKQDQLSSIVVATDFGWGLEYVAKVGSGFSQQGRRILLDILRQLETKHAPIKEKAKSNWHWVSPLLNAKVVFMEWTESRTLRAPIFKQLIREGKEFDLP